MDKIKAEPRRFIAQEVIDFVCLPTYIGGEEVLRKADLRAFVLSNGTTKVWPSGLTRYSRVAGSAVVNSSQGGGFKDTWVLGASVAGSSEEAEAVRLASEVPDASAEVNEAEGERCDADSGDVCASSAQAS